MVKIDRCLATSRMHAANKTIGQRGQVYSEAFQILQRHYGYVPFQWVLDYVCWRTGRRGGFLEPSRPSLAHRAASLFLGLWHNRGRPLRFVREWISVVVFGRGLM